MRNTFKSPLRGRPPVRRESLDTRSDDHAHEFMSVSLREPNRLVENLDAAVFIDSPDKPDLTATERQRVSKTDRLGQIAHTGFEEGAFVLPDPFSSQVGVVGLLEGLRALLKLPQRPKSVPLPDFLLPQSVVTLDGRIGGGPPLGGKDRDHPTGQTEADQLSQCPGVHPPPGQAHVVVHLQKSWNPVASPVPLEKYQDPLHPAIGLLGACDQTGDAIFAVEDHDRMLSGQVMSHDEVDLVNVVLFPGRWTRQSGSCPRPVPTSARQKFVANQNPMDCPDAVQGTDTQVGQLVENGFRTPEPQRVSFALELAMNANDQTLEGCTDPPGDDMGAMRPILIPQRLSTAIPACPSINPFPTSLQRAGHPTDGLFLQPETNALFPFLDQPRSFFDSFTCPPLSSEGLYPINCPGSVGSFTVTDHLSCDPYVVLCQPEAGFRAGLDIYPRLG